MYFMFIFAVLCSKGEMTEAVNMAPPFVNKLCEVLVNSHTQCPSSLMNEQLICFIGNRSATKYFKPKVEQETTTKKMKMSACRMWSSVSFTEIHGLKCIQDEDKSRQQTSLTTRSFCDGNLVQNTTTALYKACEEGKLDVVKCILFQGLADINCRGKYERTPVMVAARKGQETVFDFLVSHGCDMSVKDVFNNSVLHVACRGNNTNIVKKLLENWKFNIETGGELGMTSVMYAAFFGQRVMFDFLMSRGCNLTALTKQNNSILHEACSGGHVSMVKYIISLDKIPIDTKGFRGRTPAMLAAENGYYGMFQLFLNTGCDVAGVDEEGNNILHLACMGGNVELVKHVLTLKVADGKAKNTFYRTPVEVAGHHGYAAVVALLKNWEHEAQLNI